ncbi:MAG TPA: hypothetical protein VHY37_06565 [Tepidisphaeraceae bacterium]|jgi:hypothetical protein|nr:hypothetical protein [Tepidisphaeraceae bacterium]
MAPAGPVGPQAIPAADEQAKARKLFEQKYADQLADHSPAARLALSGRLVEDAANATDTPAEIYVMLIGARKAGIESGDLPTALAADKALCEAFAVNVPASRLDLLKRLSDFDMSAAQRAEVAKTALAQTDDALDQEQFDVAAQLGSTAVASARRSGDATLLDKSIDIEKRIRPITDAYDRIAPALATLEKNPANPAANEAVGRFYCFVAGRWETGLPHLAAGPKGGLATAAALDQAGAEPLAVAEQWKSQIDHVAALEKPQVRQRAIKWVATAIASLNGDQKDKAQDELSALNAAGIQGSMVNLMPAMIGKFTALPNGVYALKDGDRMTTKQEFVPPIAFHIVARTDSTNIRIAYAADEIIFNWELNPDQLRIGGGPANGRHKQGAGRVPINTWVTIDLVVLPDSMTISVDGQQRYFTQADFSKIRQTLSIFQHQHANVGIKSIEAARPRPAVARAPG